MESAPASVNLRDLGYLSEADTANLLSVKVVTLRNWRARKAGPPFVKVNGDVVAYPLDDIRKYLKERTVSPEKPASTLARPAGRRALTPASR